MANNSSVIVNELRNSTYTNADVLRFHLNDNLMLLNPKETFLRFNLSVGAKGTKDSSATGETDTDHWAPWFMDVQGSSENIVKSVRIASRKDGKIIEEINDYNLLCKKVGSYTQNESMEQMKRLYYGADTSDVRQKNTLTERAAVPTDNTTQDNKQIECFLKLSLSGILGDKANLFPCFACPLELQIELESDGLKVVRAQSARNAQGEDTSVYDGNRENYSKSVGYTQDMAYNGAVFTGVDSGAITGVTLNNAAIAGVTVGALTTITTGAVASTGGVGASQSTLNEFPFYAGQELDLNFVGATSGALQAGVTSALVKKVSVTGTSLQVEFHTNLDLSAVDGGPTGGLGANDIVVSVKDPGSAPTLQLSSVELVCGIVKPDEATISKYQSAIGSGQGMGLVCQSWYDYPVNSPANALVISNLINCKLNRVKAVLSWWQNVSDSSKYYEDNLRTPNNAAVKPRSYVYKLDGLQTPSRSVSLTNFQRVRTSAGWWSAQSTRETVQALKECGFKVRDLSNCDTDMVIARAFTRFPNTYSLADLQGELRMDLQFTTNTKNLLHHNFVCYDKTILIHPTGVRVVE
jgi:hypothetical protein